MSGFKFFILFLLSALLMVSCSPIQVLEDYEGQSVPSLSVLEEEEGLFSDLDQPHLSNSPGLQTKPFPMIRNSRVDFWLNYYSRGNGKKTMIHNLEKLGRYGAYMGRILREEGLPSELIYVAMVESGFSAHIKSSKGAVGYWQFIYQTARHYDLTINSQLDERKDFALSTKAAAAYYKDLYSQFKDWPLSMAGYNYGEPRLKKAIRKHGTRNFWTLASKKGLPRETRNFVPKIIAMAHIGQNPRSYGFKNINYQDPLQYNLTELDGRSHYHLSSISRQLDIPIKDLKALNPQYKTDYIPGSDSYIRIPHYF